jgi:hypothetical protein
MKKMHYRKIIFLIVSAIAMRGPVSAEQRVWTLADGTTFEAELVKIFAVEVAFKNSRGKIKKIPLELFSPESRTLIELEHPPTLAFEVIKDRDTKVFPSGYSDLTQRPREERNHYGIRIKQTSTGNYNHELFLELFIIGRERLGNKFILFDHQTASFFLNKENDKEFELRDGREVVLRNYTVMNDPRGEKYYGYLVIVRDVRGEVIAKNNSHDWLFENRKTLSERYVGNYMDDTATRVFPTRPKNK